MHALDKKSPSMYNFQTFGCSNKSSPNSLCHFGNHKVRVYSSLLYFFSWNFIWFLQKEPTTVQNFRLLTAQVKFHQIRYDNEQWCRIWNRTDWLFQNWHEEFNKFWPEHSKISKISLKNFNGLLLTKIYNVWVKNIQRSYVGLHSRLIKSFKKNILVLPKSWQEEFGKFSPKHLEVFKLGPWWHPFV